jgi:hypothetical protein
MVQGAPVGRMGRGSRGTLCCRMAAERIEPISLWPSVGTAELVVVSAIAAGLGERRPGSLPWLAVLVAVAVACVLAYGHGDFISVRTLCSHPRGPGPARLPGRTR